jgi:hypothetical protein
MAFQLPGINSLFTIIILFAAVIAIIVILLLLKIYQVKSAARTGSEITPSRRTGPEKLHEPARTDVAEPGISISETVREDDEPLIDQGDISKNMGALVDKYGLDTFTISSIDGLIIASTAKAGQNDAATYSQMWKSDQVPEEPGVRIFSITHQGSTIVGIIRSSREIPGTTVKKIESDTKFILSWGL